MGQFAWRAGNRALGPPPGTLSGGLQHYQLSCRASILTQHPNSSSCCPTFGRGGFFSALCRRYGLEPFRYKRQRYTTVVVRAPKTFVNRTLWPEYQQLREALNRYLNEATDRIIREEVYGDIHDARAR